MRVLIVEDNPLALWTGRVCLEKMGCKVIEAASCFEAEEIWKTLDFDLVIMDYRLPDGLGVDTVDRMLSSGHKGKVIYLTAETESIPKNRRHNPEVIAVLNKPLDIAMLKTVIIQTAGKLNAGSATSDAMRDNAEKSNATSGKRPRKFLSDSERDAVLGSVVERN